MATPNEEEWVDVPQDEWIDVETPPLRAAPAVPMETTRPSDLEIGLRGAAQGATLNFADEGAGLFNALIGGARKESLGELYREGRDESRAAFDAAQRANPELYFGSELGGGLATALIPGGAAAKGAQAATKALPWLVRAGKAAGTGFGLGALSGAGASRAELTTPENREAAKFLLELAGGGAAGGTLGGVGSALGSGAAAASRRYLAPVAKRLGEYSKEKAAEFALNAAGLINKDFKTLDLEAGELQQLGQWLLDKKIVTPFASKKAVADRLASARQTAGAEIGRLLDKAAANADPSEILTGIKASGAQLKPFKETLQGAERAARTKDVKKFFGYEDVPTPEAKQAAAELERQIGDVVTHAQGGPVPVGQMVPTPFGPRRQMVSQDLANLAQQTQEVPTIPRTVAELNELKSEIDSLIKWRPTSEVEASANEARKAIAGAIRDVVKSTAKGALSGDDYARLTKAFSDYGPAAQLGDIARQGIAREAGNNPLGLSAMLSGLAGIGIGGGAGATAGAFAGGPLGGLAGAAGGALLGKIAKERGSSMGAGISQGLSRGLPRLPEEISRRALQSGTVAPAATTPITVQTLLELARQAQEAERERTAMAR